MEDLWYAGRQDKVPDYYRASKYKVWFRFDSIEDILSDEICNWSYADSSNFVYIDDMENFKDKQIGSLHELLNHYHRTIYFVKAFDSEVPENNLPETFVRDDKKSTEVSSRIR